MLVHAAHAAVEEAEEAFDRVGVDGDVTLAYVLLAGVGDGLVINEGLAGTDVELGLIGNQAGFLRQTGAQDFRDVGDVQMIDHDATATARFAVYKCHDRVHIADRHLGLRRVRVLADESFIEFNHAATLAERRQFTATHGFTDMVGEEPGRLVGHVKRAMYLVDAHALLVGVP